MRRLALLAGLAAALAFSALKLAGCASCAASPGPAAAGALLYAALLALAAWRGASGPVLLGLAAAVGVHAGLLATMLARGPACGPCAGAAASAVVAWAAAAGTDGPRWSLLPAIAPWTAAAALALPAPVPEAPALAELRVVVYTAPDCPYCDELRDRVLPEAVREIPVKVDWRPADSAAFVSRTPTLVISRGASVKVLEGLPPAAALRAELLAMQGGSR